jgi:hypothetical protein
VAEACMKSPRFEMHRSKDLEGLLNLASLAPRCNADSTLFPMAPKQAFSRSGAPQLTTLNLLTWCLAVRFQQVVRWLIVHSMKTGEADCDEQLLHSGETEWTSTRMPDLTPHSRG